MPRRVLTLAWAAAVSTYLLIVLGAIVRITGSGLGCGEHWPLCNGHFFPPLDDIGTVIEWSHRLVAALVSIFVITLAVYDWWLHRPSGRQSVGPSTLALGLLIVQILLGAITVKLSLPPWTVVLHLGTAMLLLATLLIIAYGRVPSVSTSTILLLSLTFVTVLFGALTANLGAAAACGGFPLCNGQVWTSAGPLAVIHWTHRLLAYSLAIVVTVWAVRTRSSSPAIVLSLIVLQILIAATMVLNGFPRVLQAAHVAIGAAVWASVVHATSASLPPQKREAPNAGPLPLPKSREAIG